MSKKSESLHADQLDNRWYATDVQTNATLAPTVAPVGINAKHVRHLDYFHLAILNKNTLHHTVAAQIRDASIAGTVLAQWSLIIGGSTVAQVNPAGVHLMATPGKEFAYTLNTVAPSVTASVSAGGWTDENNSY